MLQVHNLTVVLTNDTEEFLAVNNVSFTLSGGEIVDVVGPSGAGKSTLLHALALLTPHRSGTIMLERADCKTVDPRQWRTHVALVQQKATLTAHTVQDELLFPFTLKIRKDLPKPSEKTLRELLDSAGLEDIELSRPVCKLSVGQQARVAFLRTVITEPKVLLLDETDASLDTNSSEMLQKLIISFCEQGGAVLRVRHKPDDELASRRLEMVEGRIADIARVDGGTSS